MSPFFWLLGMYLSFASGMLFSGFIYKTIRDKRNREQHERERKTQGSFNFDAENSPKSAQHDEHTLVAR